LREACRLGQLQHAHQWHFSERWVDEEFSLISYPPGDSNGDRPDHCAVFPEGAFLSNCQHLDDLGFTTGDGGYYRISADKTCPSLSKRETNKTTGTTPERRSPRGHRRLCRNVDMEKRDANYLVFFDDPGCEEKVGSKQYSTHDDGCFENGDAYALFGGDDQDWHIEENACTDGEQCTSQMTRCVDGSKFGFNENEGSGCMHLDSIGLMSGFGSYKIRLPVMSLTRRQACVTCVNKGVWLGFFNNR
jgi:hypothetical protein